MALSPATSGTRRKSQCSRAGSPEAVQPAADELLCISTVAAVDRQPTNRHSGRLLAFVKEQQFGLRRRHVNLGIAGQPHGPRRRRPAGTSSRARTTARVVERHSLQLVLTGVYANVLSNGRRRLRQLAGHLDGVEGQDDRFVGRQCHVERVAELQLLAVKSRFRIEAYGR